MLLASIGASSLAPEPSYAQSSPACAGDCNDDGFVTVDELIRGVNIALGTLSAGVCPAFDTNDDGLVTVDEIVAAVVRALGGCPVAPTTTPTAVVTTTPTATVTQTIEVTRTATAGVSVTPTPTPTSSPAVTERVRVLIATGDFVEPGRMVTSLSGPVLSPSGFVLAAGVVVDDPNDIREVLLRLEPARTARIVLEQGQPIPDSDEVASIGPPNGTAAGGFVLTDTNIGASLLRIDDADDVEAVLGVGSSGNRSDYEPTQYVVSPTDGTVLAQVFAPGFNRALVAAPGQNGASATAIITVGDALPYRNANGEMVEGTVTDIQRESAVASTPEGGTGNLVVDGSVGVFLAFSVDSQMSVERRSVLVEGNQAPGFDAGITLDRFDGGLFTGGSGDLDTRGFATFLSGPGIDATNQAAVILTDASYEALLVIQEGDELTNVPGARIGSVARPVMGARGAAVGFIQDGPDEGSHESIGYADYDTRTFRALVATGDAAPGGGVLMGLAGGMAVNASGHLIFRGDLGGGEAAYYGLAVEEPGATLRRLVGTGDVVTLPAGGTATVTALGMIESTAGLGGEATAVNATHFTVTATLDGIEEAILLVDTRE